MNPTKSRPLLTASCLAALLALGACGERVDDTTVGQQTDTAAQRAEQAANEARQETGEARQQAGNATAEAGAAARQAGDQASTAVMGAAADTRAAVGNAGDTLGAKVDDAQITTKVNAGLAADSDLSAIRIDVDTKDGVVTLTGPVPNNAAKERATEIARNVEDVKSVSNQLTVSAS